MSRPAPDGGDGSHTVRMPSVADELSHELRDAVALLTPDERIELALRLGDEAVALYCAAQGVDAATAREHLAASRQTGRRSSRVTRR